MDSKIILPRNHVSLTSGSEIAQLCLPIKKYLNVHNFCYHRVFADSSEIMLSSNIDWAQHYHTNGYTLANDFISSPCRQKIKFEHFLIERRDGQMFIDALQFGFCLGISLVLTDGRNHEVFGFAAEESKIQILERFLSNIDILKNFALYFKEEASDIIKTAQENKIITPVTQGVKDGGNGVFQTRSLETGIYKSLSNKFIRKCYLIKGKNQNVYLTSRELECLRYMASGYSAKEIAKDLTISFRTVEKHIENIRYKTGYYRKKDILDFVFENQINIM